jgi:hypothetical protein
MAALKALASFGEPNGKLQGFIACSSRPFRLLKIQPLLRVGIKVSLSDRPKEFQRSGRALPKRRALFSRNAVLRAQS